MELEGECSATGPVEVSETVRNSNSEKLSGSIDADKVGAYGNCVNEHDDESMETKGKGAEVTEEGVAVKSTPSPTTKGYGLRKWRRIKRGEVKKDGDSNIDTSKLIVKRDLSSSSKNSAKAVRYSAGTSQQSNEFVRNSGLIGNSVAAHGSAFMAGAELENSEDSKSSTAASASNPRNKKPAVEYAGNRNLVNSSQNNLGTSVQKGQQRRESSKKPRGERVKIEKENSHSSMESDSRSSNFVFMQEGTSSLKSNGTKGERPLNSDGENRDEDQECKGKVGDDNDGNSRQFEDVLLEGLSAESSWEAKDEKSENQGTSTDRDPVIESIFTLQAAQEALEREVQKFKEIAKESEQLESVNGMQDSFDSLENEVISQKQVLKLTESKLEEATSMLTLKEAKVNELESIISNGGPRMGERQTAMQSTVDIETELETLFKQKIETEVEFLVSKAAAADQITLLERQKALASDQMVNKLGDAEQKAAMLKKEAEKLENYCKNMVSSADDTLKLQKSVFKHTFCFFSQLILLVLVIGLFIFQLSPHHLTPVVPT